MTASDPRDRDQAARAFHLRRSEKAGEGLRRIALGQADSALEGLRAIGTGGDDAEIIHDVRKDLKKLRSVVRMLREELGRKQYRLLNGLFGDAGRSLSASRDAEIKVETLDSMTADNPNARRAARVWRSALEDERAQAVAAPESADPGWLDGPIGKVEAGREGIQGWSLKLGPGELIDEGLTTSYRRGRQAMERAREDPGPENMHEWRKRAKDLWYQLRIVRKAWPDLIGEMAEEAHGLTDLLGDHHDFVVLAEDLSGRDLPKADRKVLEAAIRDCQGRLVEDSLDLGSLIYAEKPKEFRHRMRRYWRVWRSG